MTTTINASTSSGLVNTADTSGILQLQTASTAAVTIDASQNVGIGTSSPQGKLDVSSSSAGVTAGDLVVDTTNKVVYVGRLSSTSADNGKLVVRNRVGDALTITGDTSPTGTGLYRPGTNLLGFMNNGTETMRITSAGNVGIGTSSPGTILQVVQSSAADAILRLNNTNAGTYAANINIDSANLTGSRYNSLYSTNGGTYQWSIGGGGSDATIAFGTGSSNTERMRINSSGQVIVGATSVSGAGEIFNATVSANATAAGFVSTNTGQSSDICIVRANRNTTNGSFRAYTYYNDAAGSYRFWVNDAGNCQNTFNNYGAISDVKLKENITDATPKLDDLMQVKVRNYTLKSDPDVKQIGVVAQELETVFPSLVEETSDKDGDGNDLGTTTKSVKYSVFVPMLIKAMQEQQALITQLQADVAALKGAK